MQILSRASIPQEVLVNLIANKKKTSPIKKFLYRFILNFPYPVQYNDDK